MIFPCRQRLRAATVCYYTAAAWAVADGSCSFVSPLSLYRQHTIAPKHQSNQRFTFRRYRHFSSSSSDAVDGDTDTPSTTTDPYPTGGSSAVLSQKPSPTDATHLQMLSFYHFEAIGDPLNARNDLFAALQGIPGLRGSVYIAKEGVNAQMAIPEKSIDEFLDACSTALPVDPFLCSPPNLGDVVPITTPTFNRLIVRVRDYVLRDGLEDGLDWNDAGPELSPAEWHEDVSGSESSKLVLLDCRNDYESDQGTFRGAKPLGTKTFQETWSAIEEKTKGLPRDQPLHIFCTGGIRCVKVGAYLKQELGFSNVRRLQHGIIGYEKWIHEEQESEKGSLWEGENFLFDKRRLGEDDDSESLATEKNLHP